MILKLFIQKCCACVIIALLTNAQAEEVKDVSTVLNPVTVTLSDDQKYTWTSVNFPKPYPLYNQDLIIKTDYGFSVQITIKDLDIDSQHGDFLIIKSGSTLDDEGKGKVFTYNLISETKYLVQFNTVYLSLQVYGKNEVGKKGFSLVYQRIGEKITTTTDNPTTVITWPTPSGSDSIYYTAYVSGKTEENFRDNQTLLIFKRSLAEMATEYCKTSNIPLRENITEENVHMYELTQCHYTWPNSETCMKLRFALPVLLQENTNWTGYQLTTLHLEQMWIHLASTYLQEIGMDVYSVPDNSSSLTKWVVISAIVLILFLVLLYFVKMVGRYFSPLNKGKRRISDTGFVTNDNKISNATLAPHPYQSTPDFFDNDDSFNKFDIDLGLPKNTAYTDYSYPLSEEDSDIEVFDTFSNSRHGIKYNETES